MKLHLYGEGRPEHGHSVASQILVSHLQGGAKGAGLFRLVKRRLRVKLFSSTTTRRGGKKMMVVADNKTRSNGPKLQLRRFGLNTKTAFIRQHSNRCSEGELWPRRFSILEWTKPQLISPSAGNTATCSSSLD